ncbi:MAG: hypothetical protein WCA35_07625 [Kovacikia sp.]
MLGSPAGKSLTKRLLTATGLALLTTIPVTSEAFALMPGINPLSKTSLSQGDAKHGWLMADKDRDHDDDDDRYRRRRYEDRSDRKELNRAKNLARQAAEEANGGIRVYRAEDSMHGPAEQCPYVDNGDSWTFTFLGRRVSSRSMTIKSVVTVYKSSRRVIVAYNGPIRYRQENQIVTFNTNQRTVLINLLRGNCSCNGLLSNSLRTEIVSQSRSLPPGIQKRLLRGKALPPGMAKKLVVLPKQVNTYVNLPTYYNLVVLGSDLVLIDQVNYVVFDYISNVL